MRLDYQCSSHLLQQNAVQQTNCNEMESSAPCQSLRKDPGPMCDAILTVLLACREGVTAQDADLARWLRKHCTAPVLLAANKAERRGISGASGVEAALTDATRLGFGDPVAISAESGCFVLTPLHCPSFLLVLFQPAYKLLP